MMVLAHQIASCELKNYFQICCNSKKNAPSGSHLGVVGWTAQRAPLNRRQALPREPYSQLPYSKGSPKWASPQWWSPGTIAGEKVPADRTRRPLAGVY